MILVVLFAFMLVVTACAYLADAYLKRDARGHRVVMGTLLAIFIVGVLGIIISGGGGGSIYDDPHDRYFRR